MTSGDLVRIARHLASGGVSGRRGRPRQTDLCRAVSAAYYALFHALAQSCADTLAGSTPVNRTRPGWRQTYRALEHGLARRQCDNRAIMRRFPPEIREFGKMFVEMQRMRHYADYDPGITFDRFQVMKFVERTEGAITGFEAADRGQRRDFAIYVLFRHRQ